jgi:hypothetical protein
MNAKTTFNFHVPSDSFDKNILEFSEIATENQHFQRNGFESSSQELS